MKYRIHLGRHVGRGKTIIDAIGSLMREVQVHGSQDETESMARSMMGVIELGTRLDEAWDVSTGLPEERN
jgi:hypothetical protein